jgi:hypothetical protein
MVLRRWFDRYNTALQRMSPWIFHSVLATPSMVADPSGSVVLYTLLHKAGVRPYLLAAKSFLRYCSGVEVVVQSDGTLDDEACGELKRHIENVCILNRRLTDDFLRKWLAGFTLGVDLDTCRIFIPLKLINVLARFPGRRVIVFDSDLLFLRRPDAVLEWMKSRSPCVFYGCGGASSAIAARAMGFEFTQVDVTRFNSGFFGFENVFTQHDLVPIFQRIATHDRALFAAWDMEQVIWCVLLNRFDQVLELNSLAPGHHGGPWNRYRELARHAVYTHFVGSDRFRNFSYPRLGWRVIRDLRRGGEASVEQHERLPSFFA